MPKTLFLINDTHMGKREYGSNGLQPLRYSPKNTKSHHVTCDLHLILPIMNTPTEKAVASMVVLQAIERTFLDPDYIFIQLSDNDILQSNTDGFTFMLQIYSVTSTYVLFDTTQTNVFCMSCGSNNYVSIRRDADQITLDSLFSLRPPDFNGISLGTNLKYIEHYKDHIESPNNMYPVPRPHCTLFYLSKKLNFSIDPSYLQNLRKTFGDIQNGHLSNKYIRHLATSNHKRYALSSNGIDTDEFHLTHFTLTRLNLYTVLLPFDEKSWFYLANMILGIITFIIVYNRLNFNSTQVVILWMIRNILEQDDEYTTKTACGSKTIPKYIVMLWSLCSMFIGWSYKGGVSSEISIKFPSTIPNSLQKLLDTNATLITSTQLFVSNVENNESHLHEKIADLLNKKYNLDYSREYLQFMSSLSQKMQYVHLLLDKFTCRKMKKIAQIRNSSDVLDSWSMLNSKEDSNWLTAVIDTCSNFTSIKIPSNSNKFPETSSWLGLANMFFKIFSYKLSHVTQSGIYDYWKKDFTRKKQIVDWKRFLGNIKGNNSTNFLIKAKAVLKKITAGVDRYQKLDGINPITLSEVYMPLVTFVIMCCSCCVVNMIEMTMRFLKSNIMLYNVIKLVHLNRKLLQMIAEVEVRTLLLQAFLKAKMEIRNVKLKKLFKRNYKSLVYPTRTK